MAPVSDYNVTATRWEKGWELDIDGVGVTQSRSLRDAETMIRDYLRLEIGAEAARTANVHLEVVLDGLEDEVREIRAEVERIATEQREVAQASRAVAHKLRDAGLTGADAAQVMGVSEQRFSQLVNA